MWEKGQAGPAVHDPTLKNLQGTCERSLPEGLRWALAAAKGRRKAYGIIPLVDMVLDLLLRSLPVSSLSSPRWEPPVFFSAFVGLDIGMRGERRGRVVTRTGTKREEKNKQQMREIYPC